MPPSVSPMHHSFSHCVDHVTSGTGRLAVLCMLLLGLSPLLPKPVPADPLVPASAPNPASASLPAAAATTPFSADKLPYRLVWGSYKVVAEATHDVDGLEIKQVRILDAHGQTLHRIENDRISDVRLVKPLVAGEEGLLVCLTGGNSGRCDFWAYGTGARSRFVVPGAIQVDVKDLDRDGTAEVVAIYRLSDVDGGGEHHGPRVTAVYQWDGTKYVEATVRFPEASRERAKEYLESYQAGSLARKQARAASPGQVSDVNDGHVNAALGYALNTALAGDKAEANAWFKEQIDSGSVTLSPDIRQEIASEFQSCLKPLPQAQVKTSGNTPAGDKQVGSDAGTLPDTLPSPEETSPSPEEISGQPPSGSAAAPAGKTLSVVVPGISLANIAIGEPRADVIAGLNPSQNPSKNPSQNPSKTYDLKNGLLEDEWSAEIPNGTSSPDSFTLTTWYQQGKVVQIEFLRTGEKGALPVALGTVLASDSSLKKVCYNEEYVDGPGGDILFCFDDIQRGIAYGIAINGDAYLDSSRPDRVIVHVPGSPFIARRGGLTHVKIVTGPQTILYRNEAEQKKADAAQNASQKSAPQKH